MTARAFAALGALAALAWVAPAQAYERSRDAGCGVCFYWAGNPPLVTYDVNLGPANVTGCGTDALAAVQRSLARWSGVARAGATGACSGLGLAFGGETAVLRVGYDPRGANENLVVFRAGWCSAAGIPAADPCWRDLTCGDVYNCFDDTRPAGTGTLGQAVIALTTVTYQPSTGQILDADVEFAGWDGQAAELDPSPPPYPPNGWWLTCAAATAPVCTSYAPACRYMDLEAVATHEAGHLVGFAHAPESTSIMFRTINVQTSQAKRTLSAGDVDGVCTVYPAGSAALTCPATADCTPAASSGCGCGQAGAAGPLALLALLALTPRRRGTPRVSRTRAPAAPASGV